MMPFHPSFRRLLRTYLPQITSEQLDRHEALLSLRHQLLLERRLLPQPSSPGPQKPSTPGTHGPRRPDLRDPFLKESTEQAAAIFKGLEGVYEAAHKLWIARRQLAFLLGAYLQLPSTFSGGRARLEATLRYYRVWLQTYPTLIANRLSYYRGRAVLIALLILIAIVVLARLPLPNKDPRPDVGRQLSEPPTVAPAATSVVPQVKKQGL